MKASRCHWILPLASLIGLGVVVTFVTASAPVGGTPGHGKLTIERYVHSGQLLADMRTAASMLRYIFESDGPPQPA